VGGTAVSNANSDQSTFTLSAADEGKTISVSVTYADPFGSHTVTDAMITIDTTPPTVTSPSLFEYLENQATNATVADINAIDVSGIASYGFKYTDNSIHTLSQDGFFSIDSATGVITMTAVGADSAANDFEQGDNTENYTIAIADGVGNVKETVIALNELNDTSEPAISVSSGSVKEGTWTNGTWENWADVQYAQWEVKLAQPSTKDTKLSLELIDGTTTSSILSSDYSSDMKYSTDGGTTWKDVSFISFFGNSVTIAKGETSILIRTAINPDITPENNETFSLKVTANGFTALGVMTILDDDHSPEFISGTDTAATAANNDVYTVVTNEDVLYNGQVLAHDVDILDTPNTLTYSLYTGIFSSIFYPTAQHGNVIVNSDGTYTYTPSSNYNGTDSFYVKVTDTDGHTDIAKVNVTVNAVADFLPPGGDLAVVIGVPLVNTSVLSSTNDQDSSTKIFEYNGLVITSSTSILNFNPGNGIGVETSSNDAIRLDYLEKLTVKFPAVVYDMALEVKNITGDVISISANNGDTWTFTKLTNSTYTATHNGVPITWTLATGNASDIIYLKSQTVYQTITIQDSNPDGSGFSLLNIYDPRLPSTTTTYSYTYPLSITAQLPATTNTEKITNVSLGEFPAGSKLYVNDLVTLTHTEIIANADGSYTIPLTHLNDITVTTTAPLGTEFYPMLSAVTTEYDANNNVVDVAVTTLGGSGSTTITGTINDDYIDGRGGNDSINGGAGNDTLVFDASDTKIDGGTGTDTLILSSTTTSIDFTALTTANDPIKNIEIIDLGHGGSADAHQLTNLSLQDVIDMTDTNKTLTIMGDAADKVTVDSTLTKTANTSTEVIDGTSHTFDIYTGANATDPTVLVKVEQTIDQHLV
jgi:hypothetical protein